jgi:phospholipid/cholesterol/gamma-HCH transport system permease protein
VSERLEPLVGALTIDRVVAARAAIDALVARGAPVVELDVGALERVDGAGAALLSLVARRLEAEGRSLRLVNVSPTLARTLEVLPFPPAAQGPGADAAPPLERLGAGAAHVGEVAFDFLRLAADSAWFLVAGLFQRRGIRWEVVLYEMANMGSRAVGVVGLIAFLVGGTMALQSAQQLRQFGANIFVVDLIGISMTRELGPLMAAIVVAGRSGSAVAAELATMVITEEIDALKTMGLHPTRFLVVPKILAISVTQPLLTMLADVAGMFGGFLVAVFYLEVGAEPFMARLKETLELKDVLTGLVKSIVFAQLIVGVGAVCGLRTQGGADAVGRSTTTAVVAGIFAVIVADALASMVFYF